MSTLDVRMTVSKAGAPPAGQIYYDASCHFCVSWATRMQHSLVKRGFTLVPLQTPGTAEKLRVPEGELLREMRLLLPDGSVVGGADAIAEIARQVWWAAPLWMLSRLPGVMGLMRTGYRAVGARRGCADASCAVKTPTLGTSAFFPLLVLPTLAFWFRDAMAPWMFMWLLALAIFAGCKWLSFCGAKARRHRPSMRMSLGFLLAWPGMDCVAFFDRRVMAVRPTHREWLATATRILAGIGLLALASLQVLPLPPLVTGWLGMVGAVLLLHFGSFHLLSLLWRHAGVNAIPLMQQPLRSASLAEFWGRRWNTAFHELAARYTFRPLRRIFPPTVAAVMVFVVSGLVHDLVISVPARGGYGLPTLYFLIQGLATSAERFFHRRSRFLTIATVTLPAVILFHPPFVHHIILPMLATIGEFLRSL